MDKLRKLIGSVTSQLYAVAVIRCILLAVSVYLVVSLVAPGVYSAGGAVLGFVFGAWKTRLLQNKKQAAIGLIHHYTTDLEYSLHLLDKSDLNIAEQMQLERIAVAAPDFPFAKLYKEIGLYAGICLLSIAAFFIYPKLKADQHETASGMQLGAEVKEKPVQAAPEFVSGRVFIQPPAYTGLPARESGDLNVTAVAGSRVRWAVRFANAAQITVRLSNSRGEEISFNQKKGDFEYADVVTGSGLYTIKAYRRDSLVYQSDFYKLEAVPDLAPKIEPVSKNLYQYHLLKDSKTIRISARISDDFQVRQAFIVATVARGSGENVKFREVKLPLTPAQFKQADIHKSIDLNALHFTPGDELYYYWAAVDNRRPEGNFSKSDTYFIVYKDTAQIEEAELATMAVNIMPEYFRSQRQIIIDTEKLIAQRKKRSKADFNAGSNDIGYDQKLLRLRYGQYLGEEFETNIGGGAAPEGGDIVDAFTHHSDGTGEGAEQRAADGPAEAHNHDHGEKHHETESKDPLAALMEQYTHSHDDTETNTFYEQSTRSLLKMALEQMWQSELHLRTYEPEKALPFENKALEYLKSAQQKARTFVKKSGYDPPPIKENEKRLTGELKEMSADFNTKKAYSRKKTAALAAEVLGFVDARPTDKQQLMHLQIAGGELSSRLIDQGALNKGMQKWAVVAALQKLTNGRPLTPKERNELKTELYKYANHDVQTGASYSSGKKLEEAFRKKLR